MAEWTHNVCERDWFSTHELSHHESGGFRLPTQGAGMPSICCMCGTPTVSGIYIRMNENELLCKGDHEHPERWSPMVQLPPGS